MHLYFRSHTGSFFLIRLRNTSDSKQLKATALSINFKNKKSTEGKRLCCKQAARSQRVETRKADLSTSV